MKKGIIKVVVLTVVFIAAVIGFEFIFNTSGEDRTSEMSEASLPVVYLSSQGIDINPLFGYTTEMDPLYTRDTITPLYEDDLSLPMEIRTYGEDVKGISYEVRTIDTQRLIEETSVTEYVTDNGNIFATLDIQNLLDKGIEYQLVISLEMTDKTVQYYTRVMIADHCHIKECIDFVRDFHAATFDEERHNSLSVYMETDGSLENTDLSYVTIKSSLRQVCWNGFEGKISGKVQVSVKEIKKEYSVIVLSYVLNSVSEGGESEYYNVEEYYRVRWGEERMFLLDFERTMNQIFREDGNNFYNDYLCLGIRDDEVNYVSNETGSIVCFVQEGELWGYNYENGSLIKIFSFRGYEGVDERENNSQHQIRVIRVKENGGADFIVYGYMSRGEHEGEVGISVFHYDNVINTIEELIWIPSDRSYQMMEELVGRLMYVNDNNQLYILLEEKIYIIDLLKKENRVLTEGNGEHWFEVSADNRNVVWVDGGDDMKATALHMLNMETGKEHVITASENYYIRPLGFLENDLIYGEAQISQVGAEISGVDFFPMQKLFICDQNANVLKQYSKEGIYINSVELDEYSIYLDRMKVEDGSFVETTPDTIMNMSKGDASVVSSMATQDERRQQIIYLKQPGKSTDMSPTTLTAKVLGYEDDRTMVMANEGRENYYYVYAKGNVVKITKDVTTAVVAAAEKMGVVVDGKGQYIWEQAKSAYKDTIPGMKADLSEVGKDYTERCISVILTRHEINVSVGDQLASGRTVKQILEDSLQNATILDLTGCGLRQTFYYVNKGTPVYAISGGNKPVLIVGYTSSRVTIYDPENNETTSMGITEAEELFRKNGDIFIAYIIKEEH